MYKFDREAYDRRMEWYRDARFGMFIHWGLYAIPARGEWVRSTEQIPKEDYMKYFEVFKLISLFCFGLYTLTPFRPPIHSRPRES